MWRSNSRLLRRQKVRRTTNLLTIDTYGLWDFVKDLFGCSVGMKWLQVTFHIWNTQETISTKRATSTLCCPTRRHNIVKSQTWFYTHRSILNTNIGNFVNYTITSHEIKEIGMKLIQDLYFCCFHVNNF